MYRLKPVLLFVVLLTTACSDSERQAGQVPVNGFHAASGAAALSAGPDSCAIVLTPLDDNGANSPIARYQRAVQRSDQASAGLEKLGWAFVAKARHSLDPGYYTLARQVAQCIEKTHVGSPEALLLQGHVLHNLHHFKRAESVARALVSRRGLWFDYALLGDVLMEQGKLEAAADAYQTMMDQRPGPQAYSRAAHLRWLKGDLEGALDMMRMTVQANGSRSGEPAAWAQVRFGLYLLQAGEFKDARFAIQRALEFQPDYAPALLASGRLYLAQQRYPQAVEVLSRAFQHSPLPEYRWYLIEALRTVGHVGRARRLEDSLKHTGPREDPRTMALYLATRLEDVGTAVRLARQELQTREDVFTLDALAWSLYAAGRIPQALDYSRRSLAEGTQDARLYYHAGLIARATGDRMQASQWLARADALKHMLLPSERSALEEEFAAFKSQSTDLAANDSVMPGPLNIVRR